MPQAKIRVPSKPFINWGTAVEVGYGDGPVTSMMRGIDIASKELRFFGSTKAIQKLLNQNATTTIAVPDIDGWRDVRGIHVVCAEMTTVSKELKKLLSTWKTALTGSDFSLAKKVIGRKGGKHMIRVEAGTKSTASSTVFKFNLDRQSIEFGELWQEVSSRYFGSRAEMVKKAQQYAMKAADRVRKGRRP